MNNVASFTFVLVGIFVAVFGVVAIQLTGKGGTPSWHRIIEGRALIFTVLALVAVLIGGVAELLPSILVSPPVEANVAPYKPLELEGRDVYLREGCYTCHSQMIRPMRFEATRFGEPSTITDSQYDHPFQWGSKRTGPDLAREGGKYPDSWHYKHLVDPRVISEQSNMPPYAHFLTGKIDFGTTQNKLRAMRAVGVPYTNEDIQNASDDARAQGSEIAASLKSEGLDAAEDSEMVAVIAYLQRLGKATPKPGPGPAITQR
jgi:cytochrome c oxidase cbb3-type subunit I/II